MLIKRQKGTWSRKQAFKTAEGLVDTWNMYLSGDVYGYNSEAGSCCGFYGKEGKKQMIEEAKGEIDYEVNEKAKALGITSKEYLTKIAVTEAIFAEEERINSHCCIQIHMQQLFFTNQKTYKQL